MRLTTTLRFLFPLLAIAGHLPAQESMRVIRSNAVERNVPVRNIFIDDDNNKWVGNEKGVYQVHAVDLAVPSETSQDEHSILRYPGANFQLKLAGQQLKAALGDALDKDHVTTAYYASQEDELWIGTSQSGVFRLKASPTLHLIERFDNRNSRLRSNKINTIYRDKARRFWIGTDEGAVVGSGNKWDLIERYFRRQKITGHGTSVWILSDNEIWQVDRKDELYAIQLGPEMREGDIKDMEFDA